MIPYNFTRAARADNEDFDRFLEGAYRPAKVTERICCPWCGHSVLKLCNAPSLHVILCRWRANA